MRIQISARRLAHLGRQIVDFRIVGVEARYIGEAPWEARHRLFTERIFKAHNSIGQFAPHRRPDVNNRSIHPHRIHDRDGLIDTPMIGMNLCVDNFHGSAP